MKSKRDDAQLVDGKYTIEDLIDLAQLGGIFDKFSQATDFTIRLIDLPGMNILFGTEGQEICTRFHPDCSTTNASCLQNNQLLPAQIDASGEMIVASCEYGLVNCTLPIVIEGKYIASLITGQIFLEAPDIEKFKQQARRFQFEEDDYFKVLKEVPVIDKDKLKANAEFLGEMAQVITQNGYVQLKAKDDFAQMSTENLEWEQRFAALNESEKRFENLVEMLPEAIFETDLAFNLIYANQKAFEMFEYTREDFEQVLNGADMVAPKDRKRAQDHFMRRIQGETFGAIEYYAQRKSGSKFPIHLHMTPTFKDGELSGFRGVLIDITALKTVELKLKQSESLLRQIIDTTPNSVFVKDREGKYLVVNQRMAEQHGTTPENIIGKYDYAIADKWFETVDYKEFRKAEQNVIDYNETLFLEEPFTFQDRAVGWFQTTKIPFELEDGQKCLMSISVDITERKRNEAINASRFHLMQFSATHSLDELLEETLTVAEKLTGSLISYSHFVETDQNNPPLQRWGAGAKANSDKSKKNRLHHPIDEFVVWVDCISQRKAVIQNDFSALPHHDGMPPDHTGVIRQMVVPVIRGDKIVAVLGVGNKPSNYDQQDVETINLIADLWWEIAERQRVEEEMHRYRNHLEEMVGERTSELKAINQELEAFSYSVSHDLRAPLRAMDGFSQAVLEDYKDQLDDQGKFFLNRIRVASQHMSQLIDDILMLSRLNRTEMHMGTIDLSALVCSIAKELQQSQPERQVEFYIEEDVIGQGDKRFLRIALENLLGNAWKFTTNRSPGLLEFGIAEHEGEHVYFVRDNGAGFDMQQADRLFAPFQRLHSEKEFPGTGIGLSMVKRILSRHGGQIWGEGVEGQGATFYFSLVNPPRLNHVDK